MTEPRTATLDPVALHELLDSSARVRVVDIRTAGEFESVHIHGAYNVPLDLLREHREEFLAHLDEDVVLVCRSGQCATRAEETLRDAGLSNVHILGGGMLGWEAQGGAMGAILARLPYNRGPACDAQTVVAQLVDAKTAADEGN